jgi:hypothetical protein
MSDQYDNNPKASDPGTEMKTAEGVFTDRPAFKRNKEADPRADHASAGPTLGGKSGK